MKTQGKQPQHKNHAKFHPHTSAYNGQEWLNALISPGWHERVKGRKATSVRKKGLMNRVNSSGVLTQSMRKEKDKIQKQVINSHRTQ